MRRGTHVRRHYTLSVAIVEWEGADLRVNVGYPIVAQLFSAVKGGHAALPKLLWDFLFLVRYALYDRIHAISIDNVTNSST